MMIFWVLAAGLIGLALLFILPPLLAAKAEDKSDAIDEDQINLAVFRQQLEELDADLAAGNLEQAQYDSARRDLEKELLLDIDPNAPAAKPAKSGRWAVAALVPALPAAALGLYFYVGEPGAIDRQQPAPVAAAGVPAHGTGEEMPSMDVLVQRLAERMEQEPDNMEGWVMLGRSYLAMGRMEEAVAAYEKARALAPDEANVLLGYAEALAKSGGGLQGRAAELIAEAVELEPANPNALWMMGLVEYERGNLEPAIGLWTKLESLLEPGGEEADAVRSYIAQARKKAGLDAPQAATQPAPQSAAAPAAPQSTPAAAPEAATAMAPAPTAEPAAEAPQAAADGKAIQVQVSLSPELQSQAAPEDTLFIFARALEGPPMPLAAMKLQAKDLPASVTLDDSTAMMPQMRLSLFQQVLVGARISKSGNAMPQSGDLQGEVKPVTPGQAETVAVVIDGVRP